MKPVFEKVPQGGIESFACEEIRAATFGTPWHVHPEYEITLMLEAQGYRIVGDNIAELEPNDLTMVGSYLPHVWQQNGGGPVHAIVVQFRDAFLGPDFFHRPETESLRRLLQRASLGIRVAGNTRDQVVEKMKALVGATGFRRLMGLLEILDLLASSREVTSLCSAGFVPRFDGHDETRVSRVCQVLSDNMSEPISRPQLAKTLHMSEGAFSRFFKTRTGKTLPTFLNELRIGRACRLLSDENLSITDIAMTCGYGNLSNFNRQFKRLKRVTPRDYRRIVSHQATP